MMNEKMRTWLKKKYYFWVASFIAAIILEVVLMCKVAVFNRVPINFIALIVFTALMAFGVTGISSTYNPKVVFAAVVTTCVMFIGLTAYACLVKAEKMGYCWGMLAVISAVIWPSIIFMIIFRSYLIHMIVTSLCVLLFALIILYDTKLIIKKLSVDDYIVGSLLIYADFIQLFLCLLSLFGGR